MEKMGLPRDAVRNALVRDGLDPAIIDLDPNKSVAFQLKKKTNAAGSLVSPTKPAKKKKVRRKKIYWNPIDPKKLNEDSMWNIVRDAITMDKLKYDEKEFEELVSTFACLFPILRWHLRAEILTFFFLYPSSLPNRRTSLKQRKQAKKKRRRSWSKRLIRKG
jgi:hypothetical protein